MDKMDIRNRFIERRSDMSPRHVRVKSSRIGSRIKSAIDWPIIRSVHIYQSVPRWNEVSTAELAEYIRTTWPHINLVVGDPHKRTELPDNQFDVIIVPLLSFDASLNRIGFGGGWYDRFLARQKDSLKIGLAYELQQEPELPVLAHDVQLDLIITERRIIKKP